MMSCKLSSLALVVLLAAALLAAAYYWRKCRALEAGQAPLRPKSSEAEVSFTPTAVGEAIKLPPPITRGNVSVEEAISRRRSVRSYADKPLSLLHVSQLLWAAQGITDPARGLRAAPSAGATYPLEVYVVVGAGGVIGLEAGVYRYYPESHEIKLVKLGDLRKMLAEACLGQSWVREAPVSIVITAVYERTTSRYGERGERYVHMEAGHVGENIYLECVSLGLGCVVVGAFYDHDVARILAIPAGESPLYVIPVGFPRA